MDEVVKSGSTIILGYPVSLTLIIQCTYGVDIFTYKMNTSIFRTFLAAAAHHHFSIAIVVKQQLMMLYIFLSRSTIKRIKRKSEK